jgi:hypothetical protein
MANDELRRRLTGPWDVRGTLFVPPTRPQRHGEMENIKAYVKYSELYDRAPTHEEFLRRLRTVGFHSLVVSLSSLMQILYNDGVATPRLQALLAQRALSPQRLHRLAQLPNSHDRVIFFPQQILFTLKFAALHSPDHEDHRPDDDFREELVQILLMASEFLDDIAVPDTEPEARRVLLSHTVRNFLLNATDQFRYMLPRAALLFSILPREPELINDPDFIDIPSVFMEATGFALRDYIALGLALYPWFVDQSELRGSFTPDRQSINPTRFFANARIDAAVAQRLLQTLSHSHISLVAEVRERLARHPEALRDAYDVLPFMTRPLYQVRDDVVVPFSLGYLAAKFSGGIYWTIFDHLQGNERMRFSGFFGRVFELYVRRAIQRAIPDTTALMRRVYLEFTYRVRGSERKTSDILVLYGRSAIFIEATASRIKMEDTAITGDLASFEADTQKIILAKARQLTDRIRDFRAGLYTIGGLTHADLPQIYPVIATFQSMPESFITWRYFNEQLRALNLLQDPGIEPLQLLDIEEVEILEGLLPQGISLLDILHRRMADPERRFISMKNFLMAAVGERGVNEYLQGHYRQLGTHVTDLLFQS